MYSVRNVGIVCSYDLRVALSLRLVWKRANIYLRSKYQYVLKWHIFQITAIRLPKHQDCGTHAALGP